MSENTIKIKVSSWNRVVRERDEAQRALTNTIHSLEAAVAEIAEMRKIIKEIRRDLPRV